MTIPEEGKPLFSPSLPSCGATIPPRRKCRGKLWWLYAALLVPGAGAWGTGPPELDPLLLLLLVMVPTPELLLVLLRLLPVTPYAATPIPNPDNICGLWFWLL